LSVPYLFPFLPSLLLHLPPHEAPSCRMPSDPVPEDRGRPHRVCRLSQTPASRQRTGVARATPEAGAGRGNPLRVGEDNEGRRSDGGSPPRSLSRGPFNYVYPEALGLSRLRWRRGLPCDGASTPTVGASPGLRWRPTGPAARRGAAVRLEAPPPSRGRRRRGWERCGRVRRAECGGAGQQATRGRS
jgi:hypothetical protein